MHATGETDRRTDSPRAPRAERTKGETQKRRERERQKEKERREIAERSVVGLVAIVMACAMVPMCQPPRQLSPLVRSTVKYAETSKPFARVKLVVITRIDILYILANLSLSLSLS